MQENIHDLIVKGELTNPHRLLGLQSVDHEKRVIRIWRPDAQKCEIEVRGKSVEAIQRHEAGLYEYAVSVDTKPTDYRVFHQNGKLEHDPYAFDEVIGELDVHLISRGLHYELYDLLGATIRKHQGVMGVHFALWAPNASSVSLIGDFNHWDWRTNPMRSIGATGVWEIFIPGLGEGEKYKFEILTKSGERRIKIDPVAHFAQVRPKTASIVFDVSRFQWSDEQWLKERGKFRKGNVPINIYEIHPGSWQRKDGAFLNYRDLAGRLVEYCKKMHYTHVEMMGICEHPLDESWGYQVTGYFASTSRYGTPEDFQYLVNALHEHGIGVILDWVPAHFPIDDHSLARFDGTYLYEHIDPRQGFHPHWSTHIFNYGRWEVSNFLIASALFWFEKMHVDGLRVDAVASMLYLDYGRKEGEWIPNRLGTNINLEALEFIKHLNSIIHHRAPDGLMIAEESTAYPGITRDVGQDGLGFDLKWGLGWMNDTLRFFKSWYSDRGHQLSSLIHIAEYIFYEKFNLVLSHDEVVHEKRSLIDKMPGRDSEKRAGVRLLLSWMICFPGKKLLFMGGEFGQYGEWNCKEEIHWGLLEQEPHKKLQNMVAELNRFYIENPALYERDGERESFQWVSNDDRKNAVLVYLRKNSTQNLLCIHHFCPEAIEGYRIPLKGVSQVREVFNTNREEWGGFAMIAPEPCAVDGQIQVNLPGLTSLILEIEFARNDR